MEESEVQQVSSTAWCHSVSTPGYSDGLDSGAAKLSVNIKEEDGFDNFYFLGKTLPFVEL